MRKLSRRWSSQFFLFLILCSCLYFLLYQSNICCVMLKQATLFQTMAETSCWDSTVLSSAGDQGIKLLWRRKYAIVCTVLPSDEQEIHALHCLAAASPYVQLKDLSHCNRSEYFNYPTNFVQGKGLLCNLALGATTAPHHVLARTTLTDSCPRTLPSIMIAINERGSY